MAESFYDLDREEREAEIDRRSRAVAEAIVRGTTQQMDGMQTRHEVETAKLNARIAELEASSIPSREFDEKMSAMEKRLAAAEEALDAIVRKAAYEVAKDAFAYDRLVEFARNALDAASAQDEQESPTGEQRARVRSLGVSPEHVGDRGARSPEESRSSSGTSPKPEEER